ncbi:protein CTR9, partial [Tanacetum coccineum]
AVAHIYLQLNQTTKAHEALKKAVRIVPHDPEAFLDLGESFISTDSGAALEAFKTVRNLLKKSNEEVSVELLNNIGVLHFEKGEFELAKQTFKEALGDGIWVKLIESEPQSDSIGASDDPIQKALNQPMDAIELPWDKITTLSNLARLFEQLHKTETASLLYRLILFKFPEYVDAYLRLAAIAKARNNVPLSIELIRDALEVDDKNPDALCMLGDLELKNDDWVKAKDTFRAAKDASNGKDSYATLCLPLCLSALTDLCLLNIGELELLCSRRSEKRAPKLEVMHLEKSKELYTMVLVEHPANMYAANGAGVVLAEKGQFDVAKELFTQVQEAASGSVFVQIPDVWINLAHVHFAQGNFPLAIKMYQSCLRKFYYNTDNQILLYLARTHYEAEQWQDCKKTLLKAIHLAPSNYTLRFDTGVALQKFSASTLQKTKRTVDEVRATVAELKNAVRLFSQLSAATNLQIHGFDEKKIETHVGYCKHLLEAAKVHCDAAELEDQQNKHRLELARQAAIREEESRLAEEQKKVKLEKRKQEDELKKVMQQEQHLERIKVSDLKSSLQFFYDSHKKNTLICLLRLGYRKIGRVVGLSEKTGLKEMMRRADRVKRGKEKVIESEIVKKYGDGERRKRRRMAKGKSRPTDFDKVMRDKATSFFFTNFPDSWDSAALWKMFSRYGKVVDVYIAFKKTKKDTRTDPTAKVSHKSEAAKAHCSHSFKEAVIGPKEHVHPQWFDDIKPRDEAGDDTGRLTCVFFTFSFLRIAAPSYWSSTVPSLIGALSGIDGILPSNPAGLNKPITRLCDPEGVGASPVIRVTPLWNDKREREMFEKISELYAIIKATEKLEKAYVRDIIPAAEYEMECQKLIAHFKTLSSTLRDTVPSIERFHDTYNMDCLLNKPVLVYLRRPVHSGHRRLQQLEGLTSAATVAECFCRFYPRILKGRLRWSGLEGCQKWGLLTKQQARQLHFDLESSYDSFRAALPTAGT